MVIVEYQFCFSMYCENIIYEIVLSTLNKTASHEKTWKNLQRIIIFNGNDLFYIIYNAHYC